MKNIYHLPMFENLFSLFVHWILVIYKFEYQNDDTTFDETII